MNQFKIGDKVRLLKDCCGYKLDDIGTIVKFIENGIIVFVKDRISDSSHKPNVSYGPSSLELIPKNEVINNYSIY